MIFFKPSILHPKSTSESEIKFTLNRAIEKSYTIGSGNGRVTDLSRDEESRKWTCIKFIGTRTIADVICNYWRQCLAVQS
ncbi:unnamed protein product [Allacma fusca]|uniref:Uncharacterized protein n=1 Tax=Allacma fusca TaxID=39272 RepID=A0A8J2LTJ1_9HEXA|nr:unnamed protein product [Allacma fusca]